MDALSLNLSERYRQACLAELSAIKPGNVHVFADGHGMVVDQFVRSAEASAAVIAQPEKRVGQRILDAIQATHAAVGCNTNLGIVLLAAPMIHAAFHFPDTPIQQALAMVLDDLDVADTIACYRAIQLAAPAGLGQVEENSVLAEPAITLLQAMQQAAAYDQVAAQYANGFEAIFKQGVPAYLEAESRWQRPAWPATAVYLYFLSAMPDTHLQRKFGTNVAQEVRAEALRHFDIFISLDNPKLYLGKLLEFDAALKARGLNPGTSADLTVATLLAVGLLYNQPVWTA